MKASVAKYWPTLARQHEGVLPFMYLDTFNYLTIGIGSLMDAPTAPEELLKLPWFHKTTKGFATRAQIAAEYEVVQNRPDLSPRGGSAFAAITNYRISNAVIDTLLNEETARIWNRLKFWVPDLEKWPADAQIAMLDMGFNLGPNFLNLDRYAVIRSAVRDQNFSALARYCLDRSNTDTSRARRWLNRVKLYSNAALVRDLGAEEETLWGLNGDPKEMAMALADEVVNKLLNDPLIDDPVTGTKKPLKWCIEKMRNDTYGALVNSRTIINEVDQTEELLTTVLAEVDQTEEGLAKAEKARIDREARLAEAYKP